MKSIAAVTLFASVVLAQSSSLIPSGISTQCSTFLSTFDKDSSLSSCTTSLISATSSFAPSTNASAAFTTHSASSISAALNSVCSTASTCPDTTVRQSLADFYTACGPELTTSANKDVIKIYDVLYAITPFRQAVCSKADNGQYCATQIAANSTSASGVVSAISKFVSTNAVSLTRRATTQSVVAVSPNATTFANNNLLFLMLQPTTPQASLCTSCTRSVLTPYISFESSTPYAPGLNNSVLLSPQTALYAAVKSTCGDSFLNGAVAAAAGLSGGIVGQATDGASSLAAGTGVASAIVGAIALAFSAAF
ncbi:hypothetical protein TRAPUB_12189 [Trametes pubescens]|uniref:Uncharacterized protein n=1 Tax=Trametes pubescens TaxID=154538 RepID=A0A1M2VUM0_TRAPU|nr:hypothetical protein TRAPUB_12189 [Trametes pubescens]